MLCLLTYKISTANFDKCYTIEAFKFTKIQRWKHELVKPMATDWERSSAKTSLHGLLTCLPCVLSHNHYSIACNCILLLTVPGFWPWHAPAIIKWGGHFGVHTGLCTGKPTLESHGSKLGLCSPNAINVN